MPVSNALTLYGVAVASSTLATANTLTPTSGAGTATQKQVTLGSGTGYAEVLSQGGTATFNGTGLQAPSGKGWFWDATTLDALQLVGGSFSMTLRLAVNTSLRSISSAQLSLRVYNYSGGTYTLLGTLSSSSGQSITNTNTNYTLTGTTNAYTFATGDKLYLDLWIQVVTTTLTTGDKLNIVSQTNAANLGLSGWSVVTQGYQKPSWIDPEAFTLTENAGGPTNLDPLGPDSLSPTEVLAQTEYASQPTNVNPLTLGLLNAASATLSNANQMTLQTATSPASSSATTLVGTALGWGEVSPGGISAAWPALGAIGSPSGKGALFDTPLLEGCTIQSGSVSYTVALHAGTGAMTADLTARVYVYHGAGGGTFTLLGTLTALAQSIGTSTATHTLSGSISAATLSAGDKLYLDIWANVTANAGDALNKFHLDRQGTAGVADNSVLLSLTSAAQTVYPDTALGLVETGLAPNGDKVTPWLYDPRIDSLSVIQADAPVGYWTLGKNIYDDFQGLVFFNSQSTNRTSDPKETRFKGLLIIRHWAELNPAEGVYNWNGGAFTDGLGRANAGDGIGLDGDMDLWTATGLLGTIPTGVFPHYLFLRTPCLTPYGTNATPWGWVPPYGGSTPYWVIQGLQSLYGGDGASPSGASTEADGTIIPAIWTEYFQEKLEKFVQALAAHIEGGPYQQWVRGVSVQVGSGSETTPDASGGSKPAQDAFVRNMGWTPENWFTAIQRECDIYNRAFVRTPIILQADETYENSTNQNNALTGGRNSRAGVQAMALGKGLWVQNDSGEDYLTESVSFGTWERTNFISEQGHPAASTGIPLSLTLPNLAQISGAAYVYTFTQDYHSGLWSSTYTSVAGGIQPNTRRDFSGNNLTLSVSGKVEKTVGVHGDACLASHFDGLTGVASATASAQSANTPWAIEATIRPTLLPQTQAIIFMNGDTTGGYGLALDGGNFKLYLPKAGPSSTDLWLDFGLPLTDGVRAPYHLCARRTGGVITGYLNGVAGPNTFTTLPLAAGAHTSVGALLSGTGVASNFYCGVVGNAALYPSLSLARIQARANLLRGLVEVIPTTAQGSPLDNFFTLDEGRIGDPLASTPVESYPEASQTSFFEVSAGDESYTLVELLSRVVSLPGVDTALSPSETSPDTLAQTSFVYALSPAETVAVKSLLAADEATPFTESFLSALRQTTSPDQALALLESLGQELFSNQPEAYGGGLETWGTVGRTALALTLFFRSGKATLSFRDGTATLRFPDAASLPNEALLPSPLR